MTTVSETAVAAATGPVFNSFFLDFPIVIGGEVKIAAGTEIKVRKPGAGELRGLTIQSLYQMDVASLEVLAPRITSPVIHKPFFAVMDPADITQLGGEVLDFLLPKAAKPVSQPA